MDIGTDIYVDEDKDNKDDTVIELPVFLSHALEDSVHLLQYPLRPSYMPYDGSSVKSARIKPNQQDIEIDIAMETRGPHYSRSRGEQYARKTDNDTGGVAHFKSGLMDQQTLASSNTRKSDSRYVAAVLKDGELHLTPLKGITQLRPTIRHIELSESEEGGGAKGSGGAQSDGDTTATESEEEEAKPVTVKFSRGGMKPQQEKEPEESWQTVVYHPMQSELADEERRLLFCVSEDHTHPFTCSSQQYFNLVCPTETSQQSETPPGPSDVLSLTKLKTLPPDRQIPELMKKAMLLQFDRVCTMLGRGRQEKGAVLDSLHKCSFLVQGCWVVQSSLVLSKELRNARDYVLWCFTKSPVLTRKDLPSVLKITPSQLRDILQPLAVYKAGAGGGWHFKQPTDEDFMAKYPLVVESQRVLWDKRHKDIVVALSIGVSPEHSASSTQHPAPATQDDSNNTSGQQVIATATEKATESTTPSRQHMLHPKAIKSEDISLVGGTAHQVLDELKSRVLKTLGRGVVTMDVLRREITKQEQFSTVSDDLLSQVLLLADTANVGKPYNEEVYAAKRIGDPRTDPYREVLLDMFEVSRNLKRKQITEEITKRYNEPCDNKLLTPVLKELCVGKKSGIWQIVGFQQ